MSYNRGELHIAEKPESAPRAPESADVNSPEALMRYGEKIKGRVDSQAVTAKNDTTAELNNVCENAKLPKEKVYVLRREFVEGQIMQSFQRMDNLVTNTEQAITQATL